ncbi:hypothetical protein J3Q64DRAFT_1708842 [Phycomyces blakesleeanus]|uniref:Uncharacterized protein n=2 Tax=Phycomyces blakesleeanus TaxID=4837 RepID=A0A162TLY4_PHYB8|nr:hypothetical protein PHYBLDRAFT_183360 [Phycomyces blakesleeanus NRRL 1555(-)]OAD68193.1 hypothetical protein PHYBLDRAFT_183360 [Phycomyces blakesleeanus NRRL 1555(-)]|eukprot:XP_018286233.1 hypothetical protein PHYBLDRAFT_183360 [Phycomyces blakesleeanus NRRL 1555(-)]
MSTLESQPSMTATEFAAYIDSVVETLQTKMDGVSGQMNEKLEDMSNRIDSLEQTLSDVVKQMDEQKPRQDPATTTAGTEDS